MVFHTPLISKTDIYVRYMMGVYITVSKLYKKSPWVLSFMMLYRILMLVYHINIQGYGPDNKTEPLKANHSQNNDHV